MEIKPIKGFESYKIRSDGQVFNRHGKPMGERVVGSGYFGVLLYKNKERTKRSIHRTVLETFVGPCPEGKQCNHINGIKTDNRVENLEWVTASENRLHAYSLGLMPRMVGESNSNSKLKNGEIWLIKKLLYHKILPPSFIGKMFRCGKRNIIGIKNKETWKHIKYNPQTAD